MKFDLTRRKSGYPVRWDKSIFRITRKTLSVIRWTIWKSVDLDESSKKNESMKVRLSTEYELTRQKTE